MGKLMLLLYFILSVFPADATENRRHIHVVRRGSKKSHRGNTVAKIWIEENGEKKIEVAWSELRRTRICANFPDIKHLTKKQREEWMIMDDQYFSFEALSRIYSVKDLLRL